VFGSASAKDVFRLFGFMLQLRAALMFTSGPSHGEVIGQLEGDPLYHASLDAAEYRQLLEEQGFAVVDHQTNDQSCFGRTVWLAQLRQLFQIS
jgi:hypothetical protein